jgi:hypothetical protein
MSQGISITTALCTSEADNTALSTGRSIAVLSRTFNTSGKCFALCSRGESTIITAWAEIKSCKIYSDPEMAEALSWHTIWPTSFLQQLIEDKQRIFLNILRVHQFATPIVLDNVKIEDKIGSFVRLPTVLSTNTAQPILSDFIFKERHQRLENLKPSEHPELEELQASIALYAEDTPVAQTFNDDIQRFLGWMEPKHTIPENLSWIEEITTSGNSSDGNLFEKRVRQAFIELGFTNALGNIRASLDPETTGGAGGIDIYCERPFPIVGECKASQSGKVGNGVCAQLINLGNTNIGKDKFEAAVKIIFASGKLNNIHAEPAAKQNKMNVMRPDTLQRLVELKVAYPGSIDLFALEPCLRNEPFGTEADKKVNDFIDQVIQRINLRSRIIQSVKALKEGGDEKVSASTVRIHFNATQKENLDSPEEAHNILLELSSPLTGYLGRDKCDIWKGDRFYYLRDLPTPKG